MEAPASATLSVDHKAIVRSATKAAGGVTALAKLLGVVPSAISNWHRDGIPPARVGFVAAVTGIPVAQLRPDLFPAQQSAVAHGSVAA